MKNWDDINVEEKLSFEDFFTLFATKLPLIEEEEKELQNYYEMYKTFLNAEVKPVNAWIAVRNVFIIKNPQIGERMKTLTL